MTRWRRGRCLGETIWETCRFDWRMASHPTNSSLEAQIPGQFSSKTCFCWGLWKLASICSYAWLPSIIHSPTFLVREAKYSLRTTAATLLASVWWKQFAYLMGIDLCLGVFAIVHLTILDARYVTSILKDLFACPWRAEPLKWAWIWGPLEGSNNGKYGHFEWICLEIRSLFGLSFFFGLIFVGMVLAWCSWSFLFLLHLWVDNPGKNGAVSSRDHA